MAGTICTAPPGHDHVHSALCQYCGGDWYEGTCACDVNDDYDEDYFGEEDDPWYG